MTLFSRKSFFTLIHHLMMSWILIASLKILLTTDFVDFLYSPVPAGISLLKVGDGNIRAMCEIYSKLTI